MDKELATALGRIDRYLFRVKRAVRNGELALALSDTAELAEQAKRLWIRLERTLKVKQPDLKETKSGR